MAQTTGKKNLLRKVLVIDEEPIIGGLIANEVLRLGLEYVGPAYDFATALHIIENKDERIDAALVDITLAELSAFDLCHALHKRGVRFAFASEEATEIGPPWRYCPHIRKPFTKEKIAFVLTKLLH